MEVCMTIRAGDFLIKLGACLAFLAWGYWLPLGFLQLNSAWGALLLAPPPLAIAARPALRRDRRALVFMGLAMIMAMAVAFDPGWLAWTLFWVFAGTGALLPGVVRFGDAWQWLQQLVFHAGRAAVAPVRDARTWLRAARRRGGVLPDDAVRHWVLPVVGCAVILTLFTQANPVLAQVLGRMFDWTVSAQSLTKMTCLPFLAVFGWSVLRPRLSPYPLAAFDPEHDIAVPAIAVRRSLIAFNALFALQNLMDLAWLWRLAPLPQGMTLAEYAHRGAYPLVVTALLAAAFVLIALRPGSETAEAPLIRRLVAVWVAQNVLLVINAGLRTTDYIAAYSLTPLRIAALLWMGLVALGLVLVLWRLLAAKSSAWLINANAAAALALLAGCCFADFDAIAARYNIDHARELGGTGAPLDLCYLMQSDASILPALADLERRPAPPAIHAWAMLLRADAQVRLINQQNSGGWTLRAALELDALPNTLQPSQPISGVPDCRTRDITVLRNALAHSLPLTPRAKP
jgi:hypothetical protein